MVWYKTAQQVQPHTVFLFFGLPFTYKERSATSTRNIPLHSPCCSRPPKAGRLRNTLLLVKSRLLD